MRKLYSIGKRLRLGRAWRPRVYFAVAIPAVPLFFALTNVSAPRLPPLALHSLTPQLRYLDLTATMPAALPEHSILLTLEEGDTLDSVLVEGGIDRGQVAQLTRQLAGVIDLNRLRPGHLIRFHHCANGEVDSVEMKVNGWGEVEALRTANGFQVQHREAVQQEIDSVVASSIDTSLYDALRAAGEGPQLVQQIVDVFQWDIDFFALQKGDSFSLVVKKRFAGADPLGYGPIEAARFIHNGQTFEAFRQETPDGRAGYYARNASPLRKQFLRAPLQFTRITSHFSKSRWHPILHCFKPHHGVDYGAPVGTPVMTTADGVVVEARRKGGEGNYVRIRHSSRIDTYYLHLSRFAPDVRRGQKVMQGQVIGYVGSTGLATGPHLDYRVKDGSTWLDPLKLKSITPDPLHGELLRQFRARVLRLAPKLATQDQQLAEFTTKRRALF
jgi:murein DD-endopeptidase MepM/ murein hydrolase activator NlpD